MQLCAEVVLLNDICCLRFSYKLFHLQDLLLFTLRMNVMLKTPFAILTILHLGMTGAGCQLNGPRYVCIVCSLDKICYAFGLLRQPFVLFILTG